MRLLQMTSALAVALLMAGSPVSPATAAPPRCAGQVVTVFVGQGDHPTVGRDVVLGTTGSDEIRTGRGNDLVCGRGGDDEIFGGRGNDVVHGSQGDDDLRGGPGDDHLYGGRGGDFTAGNSGNDFCDLGPGPGNEGDLTCESGSGVGGP